MRKQTLNINDPKSKLFSAIDTGDIDKVLALIVYAPGLLRCKN